MVISSFTYYAPEKRPRLLSRIIFEIRCIYPKNSPDNISIYGNDLIFRTKPRKFFNRIYPKTSPDNTSILFICIDFFFAFWNIFLFYTLFKNYFYLSFKLEMLPSYKPFKLIVYFPNGWKLWFYCAKITKLCTMRYWHFCLNTQLFLLKVPLVIVILETYS